MRTLYLVRHSKSSWNEPELSDIERPLNKRGKKDAPRMGKLLRKKDEIPQLIITSPAKRAFSTAKRFAKELEYPVKKIIKEKQLYMGSNEDFISVISGVKKKHKRIMIIGHNPAITEFANEISQPSGSENAPQTVGANIENIPTSGIVKVDFDIKNWSEIINKKGEIKFFEYPKKVESRKEQKEK